MDWDGVNEIPVLYNKFKEMFLLHPHIKGEKVTDQA